MGSNTSPMHALGRAIAIILLAALLAGCASAEGEVTDKSEETKDVVGVVLGKYPIKSSKTLYYVELDDEREIEVSLEVYDAVVVGWECVFSADAGRNFEYMKCEVE